MALDNGPQGADIALVNLDDKDKIFHIIEVQRGMPEASGTSAAKRKKNGKTVKKEAAEE